MPMSTFHIDVLELSHGWEKIRLVIDDDIIDYNASYIGQEPVSSLIEAAVGLEENNVNNAYFARWSDEPGRCCIDYYLKDGTLLLDIGIETPDQNGELRTKSKKYYMPFPQFQSEVRDLAIRVLKKYGIVGFNSNWASYDGPKEVFPVASFLRLLGMEPTFDYTDEEYNSSFRDEINLFRRILWMTL